MPRIPREEQATICHRVDVEGQKVADIAAAYGCTPANIYAILAKFRRQEAPGTGEVVSLPSVAEAGPTSVPAGAAATDLFGALLEPKSPPAAMLPAALAPPMPSNDTCSPPAAAASDLPPARLPSAASTRSGRVGAASRRPAVSVPPPRPSKAGYALLMRTSDGEETLNPFRSLDELLAATKPLPRTAARSPEPIWFSIQQVDLDTLEDNF